MTYCITPLPLAPFRPLFALDDAALEQQGARRMIAETPNSAPCRVSLIDAEPGERLILLNHGHLTTSASPYRATGPIFVREAAVEAPPVVDALPAILVGRLLSLRAYDRDWMMTDAEVAQDEAVEAWLAERLADPAIRTVHIHTARRGCYMAAACRR
ncbi:MULTISPECIES: DUF1203 domain-containing protein [unclassified Brevundimonas]|uniref:DUF1203 domain-containing protein n=1 Tax=unclassified Brevundimonas TaxID=2622653 RepID=UPI003F8DFA66